MTPLAVFLVWLYLTVTTAATVLVAVGIVALVERIARWRERRF